MSARLAKLVSRGLIVLAAVGFLTSVVLSSTLSHRQTPSQIVVVGDPAVGDGAQVLAELQERRDRGDQLTATDHPLVAILFGAVAALWLVTGSLIVSRQPRNTSGWLFSSIGTVMAVTLLPQALVVKGLKVDPGSVPFLGAWAVFGDNVLFIVGLIPLLFLLFPDGLPPSPRWRLAQYALFGGLAVAVLAYVVTPGPLNNYIDYGVIYQNPLGIAALSGTAGLVSGVAGLVVILASLSTVVAVRGRFKRSTGEERQQLRWLVAVATVAGILFVLNFFVLQALLAVVEGLPDIFIYGLLSLMLTIAVGVPGSYLIAIYRYRLYDLDLVVKKTVVFALMVAAVVMLYLLVAVVVPLLLVGAGGHLQVGAVALGVAIGILVFPVRARAQRLADRLVYGRRATPYEVLTSFSGRVGETYSTDDVLPRMAQILAQGVGADAARIWLLVGSSLRPEAAWPAGLPSAAAVPVADGSVPTISGQDVVAVHHQGEMLGALSVTMPASDPMTPAKGRLVHDLASQAGLVLRNVRLIGELRASRQRLVAAQDDERRKLERDIHDGVQQQLVALAVKLKLADTMVDRDVEKAHAALAQLGVDAQRTLEDLRDLARGIYPPLLADKGLVAALESQARRASTPVTVESDGVGRYSRDVEATVYFCALEALNNVAKYANASSVSIALAERDGAMEFRVIDDGSGFDHEATSYGTGLQGMADRLDAVGGSLTVESRAGSGTNVSGRVPLAGTP
ncbi:MAG: sensor histidine kinase [Actinomycetota bacterium]